MIRETVTVEIPWRGGPGHTELRSVDIEVVVDAKKVAEYLALKAVRNQNYTSTAMNGGIRATALHLPKMGKARIVPFKGMQSNGADWHPTGGGDA